ncbi:hypothetical protein V5F38_05570 [Xanthobacter sp. V0B-10]|uniref:hypothetical protein n=1 Tax=Xanthobacter albus TaxID=3119929 RepID=UPI00372A4AAF
MTCRDPKAHGGPTFARARRARHASAAVLAWAGLAFVSVAHAADLPPPVPVPVPVPTPEAPWQFEAALYGWATGINGDIGIRRLPTFPVDASFADIVSHLDGAFMGSFLAKKDGWLLLGDIVWSRLSDDANLSWAGRPQVDVTQKLLIVNGIAGYRLPIGGPGFDLSATAGFRYQRLTLDAALTSFQPPFAYAESDVKAWLDPVFGLALQYRIDEKWFVNALADIGGFGVGSKLTSQGFVAVGYNWSAAWSTALGYRALYTDYQSVTGPDADFRYTTTIHGPFLSVAYHF